MSRVVVELELEFERDGGFTRLIDEDEGHAGGGGDSGRKRKAVSMGEVQVHMSLASCEGQQPAQRRRKEADDGG